MSYIALEKLEPLHRNAQCISVKNPWLKNKIDNIPFINPKSQIRKRATRNPNHAFRNPYPLGTPTRPCTRPCTRPRLFSLFDYEDENDDEDDCINPATRNAIIF